ncbi:glycerophosphodiester phosphodiesterase GDPD4 isoform X1 [Syzygium oleosum]|uniref:glycerophosphodiester phosphodiesterase GDPD4 isoform X1 n=1 Tax=Syzygium oleosum TaxID=219896 RepID=UPI0024BB0408|nr:glycerophosphodiester phosphodiesterase GDPD4 isoform X1 [Syzygium oleosum]
MAILGRRRERELGVGSHRFPIRLTRHSWRRQFRILIICLALVAILPPIFFHFRLKNFRQAQFKKCSWLSSPPLVCAHGGDLSKAFANTMAAYQDALRSQVDCIEIDVSRSSDGVLLALHDRDLQRISGDGTSRVGHLSIKEIKELESTRQSSLKFADSKVLTAAEALKSVSRSVRQVILDAKVSPPSYESGLAKDILSAVEMTECNNCLVWAKNDDLVREVIKLSSNLTVRTSHFSLFFRFQDSYIVMKDPSTGLRSNLLRVKGAGVVGVSHPLIDDRLMRTLHSAKKKVYAWTVDDLDSMQKMLYEHVDAIVTSKPTVLQHLMQNIGTQCLEEGYSF